MPWLDDSHNIVPSDQKKLSAELKAGINIIYLKVFYVYSIAPTFIYVYSTAPQFL